MRLLFFYLFFENVLTYILLLLPWPEDGADEQCITDETVV